MQRDGLAAGTAPLARRTGIAAAGVLAWVGLSLAGWAVGFGLVFIGGWFLVEALTGDADQIFDGGVGFSLSLVVGFSLAGAGWATGQWLRLRRRVTGLARWVLGAALGFAVLASLNLLLVDRVPLLLNELVHNVVGGAVMGIIQQPVVRRLTGRARPWTAVTVAAMLTAAAVSATVQLTAEAGGDIGGLAGVTVAAAVTGIAIRRWTRAATDKTDTKA